MDGSNVPVVFMVDAAHAWSIICEIREWLGFDTLEGYFNALNDEGPRIFDRVPEEDD